MIGRRTVVGLSLLSALLFSAFAVQSASALVVTTSNNTTGVTCVKGGGSNDFKDSHCDEQVGAGTGEYGHVAISNDKTMEGAATNAGVTNSTKDSEPAVLKGTIGLAKVTIECTTVKNNVKTSLGHNTEPVSKQHTVTGSGETEFSTCNVKELAKCVVKEPIIAQVTGHGVEGMEGPKGEANAMGGEVIGAGAEERFAELTFLNKGAEACSLNGKTFPIKGRLIVTNGPTTESAQNRKYTGATAVYTPKFKMQTLKLGPNTAELSLITKTSLAASGTPVSLTTTT